MNSYMIFDLHRSLLIVHCEHEAMATYMGKSLLHTPTVSLHDLPDHSQQARYMASFGHRGYLGSPPDWEAWSTNGYMQTIGLQFHRFFTREEKLGNLLRWTYYPLCS